MGVGGSGCDSRADLGIGLVGVLIVPATMMLLELCPRCSEVLASERREHSTCVPNHGLPLAFLMITGFLQSIGGMLSADPRPIGEMARRTKGRGRGG